MGSLLTPEPDLKKEVKPLEFTKSPANLSVLIPVYNFKVTNLVNDLYTQLSRYSDWEIRVYDDAGKLEADHTNCKLHEPPLVIYKRLPENLGRSGIRSLLAREAIYDRLLFVDADSEIASPNYIKQYLSFSEKAPVLAGGTIYKNEPPPPSHRLRWYYGKKREVIPASTRNLTPYEHVSLNNIFFTKEAFNKLSFNPVISGYGHEDTLLALQCKNLKIPILHIDNPVYHVGLESSSLFLDKSLEAVDNFFRLKMLGYDVRFAGLDKAYQRIKKFHLEWLLLLFVSFFRQIMIQNLISAHPFLRWLDLLKLEKYILLHREYAANLAPNTDKGA